MLVFNLPPGRFLVYGFTLIVIRSKRHSEPIFVGLRGLTNWNLNDSLKQKALHEPSNVTGCYTRSWWVPVLVLEFRSRWPNTACWPSSLWKDWSSVCASPASLPWLGCRMWCGPSGEPEPGVASPQRTAHPDFRLDRAEETQRSAGDADWNRTSPDRKAC